MKNVPRRKLRRAQPRIPSSHRPRPLGVSLARCSSILAVAGLLFASVGKSTAASLVWDSDGTPGMPVGGAGVWNSPLLWDNGGTMQSWVDASTAVFDGNPGTVTIVSGVIASGLVFETGGYLIAGGGGTLTLAGAGTIRVAGMGTPVTISAQVSGSAGLTKIGDGTVVLANSANNFTGDLVINAGTLVISDAAQLGSGTTAISINGIANTGSPGFSGGGLLVRGSLTGPGLTIGREISVAGRGPGAANGVGGLTSIGNNTFTNDILFGGPATEGRLQATHGITTLTGRVTIGSGTGSNVIGGNGNWVIEGRLTGLDTGGDRFVKTGYTVATTLWLKNDANDFLQPLRIDSGTVRVSSLGALGANTGTQALDFNGGVLELLTDTTDYSSKNVRKRGNGGGIFVDHTLGGTQLEQTIVFGNLLLDANSSFTLTGRDGYGATFTGAGGTINWSAGNSVTINNSSSGLLTIDANINRTSESTARNLSISGNGDTLMTGEIRQTGAGAVSLVKNNRGTFTLQGANSTATGATTINDGTLVVSSMAALPSGILNIGNGTTTSGAFAYAGAGETSNQAIKINTTTTNDWLFANGPGALILDGAITAATGNKTLFIGGTSTADNEIASAIPSAGATLNVQKIGGGTWVLSGANLYTGQTTVAGGILKLKDTFSGAGRDLIPDTGDVTFNTDSFTQAAGGTLEYLGDGANASNEILDGLTLTAGAGVVKVTAGTGGTAGLAFGSLNTPAAGTGLNFVTNAGASITIATAINTNGILDAHAYFNGADFAAGSGVGAASYTTENTGASLAGGNTQPYLVNTADIAAQATAAINAGIKFNDSRTMTLASGATLTIQNGSGSVAGGLLVTGGSSVTITGGSSLTTGGSADLVVRTDTAADILTLATPIDGSTTGGLTKNGVGALILSAANANTGTVTINEGTIQLSGAGTLGATNVGLVIRQAGTLDLNGVSVGTATTGGANAFNGAGLVTNSAATGTAVLRVGNGGSSGYFTGTIQDGATADVALSKGGAGTLSLSGVNTFTGPVTINGGTLTVTSLANIGQASGLGKGDATDAASNAASLVFQGGTLSYTGANSTIFQSTRTPSVNTDRLFTLAGNGAISSDGSAGQNFLGSHTRNDAALVFGNTAPVAFSGAGARTLTLQGDSLGDNRIGIQLVNNPNAGESLSVTKSGSGFWIFGNTGNSYDGNTTISGGTLRVGDDGSALTRTLPQTSALVLGSGSGSGVVQTEGTFSRPLAATATPGAVTFGGTTGGGGFAASTGKLTVNLGGAGDPLTWGSGGFVGTGGTQTLFLGSSTSWADVELVHPIDLNVASGTVTRTIQVDDNSNTGLDFATLSGAISNSGAGTAALTKSGGGTLILGGANTYGGNTTVTAGAIIVDSIGAIGDAATSIGTNVGGGNLLLGNGSTGAANLLYVGPGETTTRTITINTTTGTDQIDASGSGPLILTSVTNGVAGAKTVNIRGSNTDANMITSTLANNGGALTVSKYDSGVWVLNPTGGPNTFTGNINANGGTLGLTSDGIGSAGLISISNGGIFAHGGPLTTNKTINLAAYATQVIAGKHDITFDGTVQRAAGNGDNTFSNNLENGAVLTVNGDLVNLELTNNRTMFIRGYGSTVWNGEIKNSSGAARTRLDIRMADGVSFTLNGANSLTGGILLGQGRLVVGNAQGLGPAANVITLDGGVLTSTLDLTGANAIQNKIQLQGDQVTIAGSYDIELAGAIALEQNNNRYLLNNLDAGRTLTISGTVNLTTDSNARTLTVRGTGVTQITGVIANGGSGASGLAFSGVGSLELTNAETASGALTVNRALVILSGPNGSWNNGSFVLNPTGTLRLDNTGGDNPAGRLSNTGAFTGNGGTIEIIGDADGSTHTAGPLTLNGVQTIIRMTDNTGGLGTNLLNFASVSFPNTGSSLNLLGVPLLGTVNKVTFTAALPGNAQIGSVMPRTFIGNDFATYDTTDGIKAFASYNPSSATDINAAAAADTVEVNAGMGVTGLAFSKTINALKFNGSGLSVSGVNRTLTLGAAAVLNTGGDNTLDVTQLSFGGNTGYIQVAGGTTLTVNSTLIGSSGMAKSQAGTLVLNTPTFIISTTNVLNGTLKLNAGLNTLFPNQLLNLNDGATLDLNGNAQYVERLLDPGVLPGSGGVITSSSGAGTLITNMNNASAVVATQIMGNVAFARVGGYTLTFETAQTYAGSTTLMGGTLALENDATILATSAIDIHNATLQLNNNSSLQTANYDRIGDTIPIALRTGTIYFAGKVSDAASETFGAVTAEAGGNTITVNTGGFGTAGAFTSADVTFASLTRTSGSTVNFTGSNLGSLGNNARMVFTTPLAVQGGGLLGAWAIANWSDYAAYNTTNGVGVVGSGGFTGYDPDFGSGKVTNLNATAAMTTTLPAGTTTSALLRFAGGFTNALEFTNPSDVLHLELGGILRSNNNNLASIGTTAVPGIITSGTSELVVYANQNVLTINSVIDGATGLVKSGSGTVTLTNANSYTLGTTVAQGTLRLEGGPSVVVIPAGGLTIENAAVTMVANSGQIEASNAVTLNGSATLTLAGGAGADNTLASVTFNNNGGTGTPVVSIPSGTILTLSSSSPVTVTSSNALTVPTISGGTLAIGGGANTFNVGEIELAGQAYDRIRQSLNISSVIAGAGASIVKTGAGLMQLSGQGTFDGGVNVTSGGIVLGTNSSSTVPNAGVASGPLGTGTMTMSVGTSLFVDDNSRTVANPVTFAGDPIFSNVGGSTDTLTLNGPLSFATLGAGGLVVHIDTPYLNVALNGPIVGIGSVTSIGGTGPNTISATGLGNLTSLNVTGLGSAVPINPGTLSTGAFTLLHDGDGTSGFETIQLGTVTWEPISGALALTIGRAGTGEYFPTPAFKTIALAGLNSSMLPSGMTLTVNNGYGLDLPDNIALNTVAVDTGATFTVNNSNTSLQVPGFTLSGILSGGPTGATARTLIKSGSGTLVLGNAANSFGGGGSAIDITDGIVQVAADSALGDPSNVVRISANSSSEGLRVAGTFATNRAIDLNGTNSGIDVTQGNTLTLNSAFTFTSAANNLAKNDLGTLVLTQTQPGWDGVLTINQGVVRITDPASLGSAVGSTAFANVGGALELVAGLGGLVVADPLEFNTSDDATANGINGGGAVRAVAGVSTLAGGILINTASGTNDRSRAATFSVDAGATLNIDGVVTGTVGNGTSRDSWLGLGGAGDGFLNTPMALAGVVGTNRYFSINKFGTGTWTITAANAHPGTRVMIKQGTLALSGAGSLGTPDAGQETTPTVYLNPTAVLKLDNSGANVDDRLGGRALNVSGADVTILGNAAAATSETVGAFTLREGASFLTLSADAAQALNFATGALTRSTGASLIVRGSSLGAGAGAGVATMTGNAYAFAGQTGGTGMANKAILPWAFGDTNLAGNGTFFLTADSADGGANTGTNILRPLSAGEQTGDFATASANVNLSTAEPLSSLATFNSLRLAAGGGAVLQYVPLTLESGGLLALGGNAGISGFSGVSYLSTTSNRELILHTAGDLALDVPIAGTTGVLVKSGAGTLTLTAGNTNHSTVYLNDGTLKLDGGNQTILPGRNLQLNEGGTLDLNGTVQNFNLLESRLTAALAQSDLYPANSGGTVTNSAVAQATLALSTANVTFAGVVQGNVALARSSAAGTFYDWNLYSDQTYTGPTLLNGGRAQLLDAARLSGTSSIEISHATLAFSTSNGSTEPSDFTDRINAAPIALRGGMLQVRARASLYTTETMGAVTLSGANSVIDMAEGGTRINQADYTIASLTQAPGSHATVRFYNIDATPSDDTRLFITTAPALTNNLIGPWAVFEREFASYIPAHGVGALNTQGFAGYSPNQINNGTATDNIRIALPAAGLTTTLTADRTIGTLNLNGAGSSTDDSVLNLGTHTLTLAGGGMIVSGATDDRSISIINGKLTAGVFDAGGDLYLHTAGFNNGNANVVNRDVNIGARIVDNGAGPVTLILNAGDGRGTGIAGALGAEATTLSGNNTYSGGTFINAGRVILNNASANGTTITATGTGDVTIAGGASTNGNDYREFTANVLAMQPGQIANTATVHLKGGAVLNFNNNSDTLLTLDFNNTGGQTPQVTTGTGTLTLNGYISASGQNGGTISQIDGRLNFSATDGTIIVDPVQWNGAVLNPLLPNLVINASILGVNVIKAGDGILRLNGANAYTGTMNLQAGGLAFGSNSALSSGSLNIGNNTFLASTSDSRVIANDFTVNGDFALRDAYNLTMNGTGSLLPGNHTISVDLATKQLTLGGVLTGGGGLTKSGDGTLMLGNNSNAYAGATIVADGVLRYGAANAVPVTSAMIVLEGGLLDITTGGADVTVGSLAGNSATQGGVIITTAGSGTITFTAGADGSSTSFGGVIANLTGSTLNFVKAGAGTMTLGGANLYNGSTTVMDGRLVARPVAGNSPLGTGQSLILGGGATSGILQLGDSSGALDHTFTSLATSGSGTLNKVVSGNAAMGTLTLDLASTTTFAGNIGGAGANEANLHLVKSGAGELVISGSGTSTYSGSTTVNGGKLFIDTTGAFPATTTSLTLADGAEFSLRGTSNVADQVYGFTGAGNRITVGTTTGATLGFGIDGAFNSRLDLATGQTMTVNGALTTAVYVNSTPVAAHDYILINGADPGSLHAGAGTFNIDPVIFNGGSFTYTLRNETTGGTVDQWILTPAAVAAAPDTWWMGDLTGLGAGVWSATTTSGVGFPSNWGTDQGSGTDAVVPPDAGSIVHFSANGAGNFATTLGANLTIEDMIFHTGSPAVSVGNSNGANTLTIGNGVDPGGLTIETGAGDVAFTATVELGQSQSWNIEDTARVLTLSGGLIGSGVLTVNDTATNAGNLVFAGIPGTLVGTVDVNAGRLIFDDTGSLTTDADVVLGTATDAATLQVGNTAAASNAVIGGLSNGALAGSSVVGGNATMSTLTIGAPGGTQTFSGALGGAGANENQFNLVKAGGGTQVLDGPATYAGTTLVREGVLKLGTASTFAPTGALSVIANIYGAFDFNGNSFTTTGDLTLGGTVNGVAQILDTNATKGVVTLGGNIIFDATNDPGAALISANLAGTGGSRTITVGDSLNATDDLTLSGTYTVTSDNSLSFAGAGSGLVSGDISISPTGGQSSNRDANFNGTGTWTISAKLQVGDDININTGVINATVGESLDAADDVVIDGTGIQGSVIVNINSATQVHTGDAILIRNGAQVNVTATGGIGTGTERVYVGDSASGSPASAGLLNLAGASISIGGSGLLVGAGSNIGNITGTGTITTAGSKDLRNGSIEPGITLAGNGAIYKQNSATVVFSGDRDPSSTGATYIREGNLILDYTTNNNSKIGGVLNLGLAGVATNAILTLNGSNSTSTLQSVASTTVLPGNTTVSMNNGAGQLLSLNLGGFTRTASGGTVAFEYLSTSATALSSSPAGTLGWATVQTGAGTPRFAAIDLAGNIVQAALTTENDVTLWSAGQDIINSGALSGVATECNTISSLTFAATSAATLNIAGNARLGVTSGGILVTPTVGAFDLKILGGELSGNVSGTPGELIVFQRNALGTLTIGSKLVNSSGVTKTGAGTLVLTGSNSFLPVSQVNINEGTVQIAGGNAIGDTTGVSVRAGATLNLNNSDEAVGHLQSGSAGTIALGTGDITFNQTASSTFYGAFTGAAGSAITVNGFNQNLNVNTASSGFAGTVTVNGGLLQLSGSGTLSSATAFTINKNANLLFDNNGGTRTGTRISDSATFTLNSADGAFAGETRPRGLGLRTDQDSTSNTSETIGAVTFASGANYAFLDNSGGNSSRIALTTASFTRGNGATLAVRGRNLGDTSGSAAFSQLEIGTDATENTFISSQLVGGGGTAGGTAKNVSIVPWAIGQRYTGANLGDTHMGNTLVTYVLNSGFTPLDLTDEYATYAAAGAQDNARESLSTDLTGLAGKTVNALVLHKNSTGAGTINVTGLGAGETLANTSGTFLFTQNTGAAANTAHTIVLGGFDGGIQAGAGNEYVMFVVNPSSSATGASLTARIDSPLNSALASLTKSGRGTLELNTTNTYAGGTTINEGAVLIHDNDNLGGGGITLAGGGLRFAADYTDDLGALATPGVSAAAGGGAFDVPAGSVTATGLAISGAGPLAKTGPGVLRFAGGVVSAHSGDFTVLRGTLELNTTPGVDAIAGPTLFIGGSTVTNETATVTLLANDQINNATAVDVRSFGTGAIGAFDANGSAEAIGALSMSSTTSSGVLVKTGAGGTLTVTGDITLNNNRPFADSGTNARNVVITATGSNGTAVTGGGTLDLNGANRVIRVQTSSTLGGNNDATIEAVVANGGIVKEGARRLFLTAANTYSGVTTINDGTISISSAANLGDGSATNTIAIDNSAILQNTGASVDLGANRSVALDGSGGTFDVTGANVLAVSGAISGGDCAVLMKIGTGTLVLGGNNSYSGLTTIDAGTLRIGGGGASGSLGTGAVLDNATLAFDRSDDLAVANAISGVGAVNQAGSGRTILSGIGSYTGVTTVSAGTLQFAQQTSLYNNVPANWTDTKLVVNSGATAAFNVGGAGEFTVADIDVLKVLGTGVGGFRDGASIGLDTTNAGGTLIYGSVIADTNAGANHIGLAKLGSGTLLLTAANSYSGPTAIRAGVLKAGSAAAIPGGAGKGDVIADGELDVNGFSLTLNGLSGGGVVNNSAAAATTLTVGANDASSDFAGVVQNSGGALDMHKVGSGTLVFSGGTANTFAGLTTVSGGTLSLNKAPGVNAIIGDGLASTLTPDVVIDGGALILAADHQLDDTVYVSMTSGTFDVNGRTETLYHFTNTGGAYVSPRGSVVTITDPVWGGGSNNVFGNGTYGAFVISGGTNTIRGDEETSQGAGSITIGAGGLEFAGDNSPVLTVNSDHVAAGSLVLNADVTFTGNAGTALLASGPALLSDGVTPSPTQPGAFAGTVQLGAANRTFTIADGSAAVDMEISTVIASSGGGLVKAGPGALKLAAENNYTGPTVVQAGTLEISGSLNATSGAPALQIDATGTLLLSGGSERVNDTAALTLNGGTLAFADGLTGATETLGTLTLSQNSTINFGLGDSNTFLFSGLSLGGRTLDVWNWTGTLYNEPPEAGHGGTQDHLAFTSDVSGEMLGQIRFFSDNGGSLIGTGDQIQFGLINYEIVPVPEPSSTALLGAASLLALVGFRERRQLGKLARRRCRPIPK